MKISSGDPWVEGKRTLTSFGSTAIVLTGTIATTIATGVNVDLRPAAGIGRFSTVGYFTPNVAGAAGIIATWDGTTTIGFFNATLAVNQSVSQVTGVGVSTVGAIILNNGTQTNHYFAALVDFVQ